MSIVFDNYKFMEGATEQEFFDAAVENIKKLKSLEEAGLDPAAIAVLLSMAIEVGTMDDGEISELENRMIKYTLEKTYPGKIEEIKNQVTSSSSVDFTIIKLARLSQMAGHEVMIPLLNLILCFAYVDGKFDETTAQRLADGLNITAMF